MNKPATLIKTELALLAAYRAYDALDKDGADASTRIKHGELFVRSHPQDRTAGVTLSKLRAAESRAFVAVVQAKTAYDKILDALYGETGEQWEKRVKAGIYGNDGAQWELEAEVEEYLLERSARHA
ncbi:MAG: hypothetical protein ABIH03_05710 [Pseudomonadota bacterium]